MVLICKFPVLSTGHCLPLAGISASVCAKRPDFGVFKYVVLRDCDILVVSGRPPLAVHPDECFGIVHDQPGKPAAVAVLEVDVLPHMRPPFTYHIYRIYQL